MTQTQTPAAAIDLEVFCGSYGWQYTTDDIVVRDGWRYASDGRIIVRIRADDGEPNSPASDPPAPPFETMFPPVLLEARLPWPTDGAFEEDRDCPQCGGEGMIGCDCCDEQRCLICYGHGHAFRLVYRHVGNHRISGIYDHLIQELPSVRWVPGFDEKKPLPFFFDGGEGVVMGMAKTD